MAPDEKGIDSSQEVNTRHTVLRRIVVRIVLSILGKSFASTSRFQKNVMEEVSSWPEDFSFEMRVNPDGPSIALEKRKGILVYCKKGENTKAPDLIISFKNMKSAYLLFTAQMSTVRGYCEKRMSVSGDITIATSIIRCMNVIEAYLFPYIIARRVIKRVPKISFSVKTLGRIRLFTTGVLLGR